MLSLTTGIPLGANVQVLVYIDRLSDYIAFLGDLRQVGDIVSSDIDTKTIVFNCKMRDANILSRYSYIQIIDTTEIPSVQIFNDVVTFE